jgi:hypothetical protein
LIAVVVDVTVRVRMTNAAEMHSPLVWIGLAGVEADDNARAKAWERRLHKAMVGIALLALPAYLFTGATSSPAMKQIAYVLDLVIFAAFLAELLWMCFVSSYPGRYVLDNWLTVVILVAALAACSGRTPSGSRWCG